MRNKLLFNKIISIILMISIFFGVLNFQLISNETTTYAAPVTDTLIASLWKAKLESLDGSRMELSSGTIPPLKGQFG